MVVSDSSLLPLVRRLHGRTYLVALLSVAVAAPLIGVRAVPAVVMCAAMVLLAHANRSMSMLLAGDLGIAVGLWWLFGPVSGANFIPYVVVSLAPLLLTERRSRYILGGAVLTVVGSGVLHLIATSGLALPLFHPPDSIPDVQFFVGLGIQGVLLIAVGALMTRVAAALRVGEEALKADLERQRELHELKDHFLATVSHQLRTPLTALRGFSTLMLGEDITDDERDDYLGLVVSQAEEMFTLVEDLITFSRIETGELAVRLEPVRAVGLISATVTGMGPGASGVSVEVEDGLLVMGDPSRLAQMIRNLVDNALKYGEPPVRVVGFGQDGEFRCRVTDCGPGLPSDQRATAFVPYTRLVTNNTMSEPGLGLGLAVVRELAHRQGGSVAYLDVERGFEIVLPLAADDPTDRVGLSAGGLGAA